ncbi:unnamed protein product [Meganyctiphanes norvegica]|uniref:Uncharacterized protein n=1 Tax=Meganyctiphanes norvegica TaxID=48144 RepID=A0AAV2QD73_MEGNR
MSVRVCLPLVVAWVLAGLVASQQQDTDEVAPASIRDRRQVDQALAEALDQDQLAQTLYDYRDKKAPSGFLGMRGKKAPSGFLGMRGKKDEEDSGVLDEDLGMYSEDFAKRAPSGFLGMRGKKAPSGFLGMRGRRTPLGNRGLPRQPTYQDYQDMDALIETLQNLVETHKRAPSGFLGMRGKRQSVVTEHDEPQPHDKRAPSGFLGMRG